MFGGWSGRILIKRGQRWQVKFVAALCQAGIWRIDFCFFIIEKRINTKKKNYCTFTDLQEAHGRLEIRNKCISNVCYEARDRLVGTWIDMHFCMQIMLCSWLRTWLICSEYLHDAMKCIWKLMCQSPEYLCLTDKMEWMIASYT